MRQKARNTKIVGDTSPCGRAWWLAVCLAGCGPQGATQLSTGTLSPSSAAERAGEKPLGTHDTDTKADLARRRLELRDQLALAASAADRDWSACERVCKLGTNICGVAEKLCGIAEEHLQDPEYQDLCRRARLDCREATDACTRCGAGYSDER